MLATHSDQGREMRDGKEGGKEVATESSSVSPYEHLAAQLRISEQRQGRSSITHFVLEEKKGQNRDYDGRDFFVIREENEDNERMMFGEGNQRLSTIQYRQGTAFHCQDMETSDILIKQWIVSPQKSCKKPKTKPITVYLHQNKTEEKYKPCTAIIFNTKQGYVQQIDETGCLKKIEVPEGRKGIMLVGKCRRK